MKSVEKQPWLSSLEEQVHKQIVRFEEILGNNDEAILRRPSAVGGWSILQCIEHLNSYGDYYLPRLQTSIEKQSGKPSDDRYVSSWLGRYLIKVTDPKTGSMKLKAVKQHQPASIQPLDQVTTQFFDQQRHLLRLLETARTTDVNRARVRLSIAPIIRLSAGEIFQFMVVHTHRHLLQAERNL